MNTTTSAGLPGVVLLALGIAGCDSGPREAADGSPAQPAAAPSVAELRALQSPAAAGSMAPHLDVAPDGRVVMSWLEPAGEDVHAVRFSVLGDEGFGPPRTVAEGSGWFVNWADFPSVTPISSDLWAAHWLVRRPGGAYAYDVALSLSTDGGATWPAPFTPHTDGTATEHGFVTLFPWEGTVGAVWLDGRNTVPEGAEASAGHPAGGMSLRHARFDAAGETLGEGEVDPRVCDCCQTDVALADDAPVLTYRGRTADEIRDILVTRFEDGAWSQPVVLGEDKWRIPGCPVNGPAIAAAGDRVVVAWYTAPNRQSRVQVAFSADGGRSFGPALLVDDARPSGKTDVVLLDDGSAQVIWMARTEEGGEIRMRRMTAGDNGEGDAGPVQVLASGAFTRNTGFPQMVASGDRLVFAWPEPGEGAGVRSAWTPLR